jgi:hypothetical protein
MNASFNQTWHAPLFSSLLESRREGLIIFGAGALHLGLSLAGLPAWNCPIRAVTGLPCPGCGLTRATMQFVRGDFAGSFQTHAFAPIFLFTLLLMGIALVLPKSKRNNMIMKVAHFERRSGITAWVLSLLMFYWAFRLIT